MRRSLLTISIVLFLAMPRVCDAKIVFIQQATEATVPQVLFPWTQKDACACCVCWETTLGTILAYWDDYTYKGNGPWERLFYGGNGDSAFRFRIATDKIFKASGLACKMGSYPATLFKSSKSKDAAEAYTNTSIGYSFGYDDDQWVWFSKDIAAEINDSKPVYYAYCPEGTSCHAVTVVGYDDSDKTLFVYKNWSPVVTRKGFDDCTDRRDIDITPKGTSPKPSAWTCSASNWEGRDGCHCNCGSAYDPDCDSAKTVIGCPTTNATCSYKGQCQSTCEDKCPQVGAKTCQGGKIVTCRDYNKDGCLEWGGVSSCSGGDVCKNGRCVPSCSDDCTTFGQSSCASKSYVNECGQFDSDTCLDLRMKACALGKECKAGKCVVSGCKNACQAGQTRCIDAAHVQRCVDQNFDGCLEWGLTRRCPLGSACSQNDCREDSHPQTDGGGQPKDVGAQTRVDGGSGVAEHCQNNIDDDLDGLVDCKDSDCEGLAACAVVESCDNGKDDDGDGAIDCADKDCIGAAACSKRSSSSGCHVGNIEDTFPSLLFAWLLGLILWRRAN